MSIRIIVDSASDIPPSEAEELGITVLPLTVTFDQDEYLDGVTLSSERFYEKLVESDDLPRTSQITPHQFIKAYADIDSDDQILVMCLSSKLSGTCESAELASRNFPNVRVFDTLNAAVGQRVQVLYALRLVKEGKSIDEIVELLEEKRGKVKLIALLDTLEYLKKGGRISPAAAMAGTLLSIKPVVAVEDGEVIQVGKARGSKNGNNLLTQVVEKSSGIDFDMPFCATYSGFSDKLLMKYLKDNEGLYHEQAGNVPVAIVGSTVGTHVGPGAIGIAFFTK